MSQPETKSIGSQPGGDRTPQGLLPLLGPATLIVFVAGFVMASYVFSPTATFDWTGELEQFGILRHYGIAIGCLFGLIFLWPVWNETTGRGQQVGLVLLGFGFLISGVANAMATAGIRAGGWAVIGIMLGFPLGLLVYGGGAVYQDTRQHGARSLLLGVVYLLLIAGLFAGYQLLSYVGMFLTVGVWATVMYFGLTSQ